MTSPIITGPERRRLTVPERELLDRAAAVDPAPAISDDPFAAAEGERAEVWAAGPADAPLGVAIAADTGQRWALEFAIEPDQRRAGIGGALADRALTDLRDRGVDPWAWSHGDHPAARRIAERRGWYPGRILLQLRTAANLTPASYPPVEPPEGLALRTFDVGRDEPEWQRVNNAAFDWHPEQGNQSLSALRAESSDEKFAAQGFFIATPADDPGAMLGFHQTAIDERDPALGWVYVVGVDPAHHGRGLGSLLTAAGLHSLVQRGVTRIALYVEGDNEPALAVYRKLGFETYVTDVSYTH